MFVKDMPVKIDIGFNQPPPDPGPEPGFYEGVIRITVNSNNLIQLPSGNNRDPEYYRANGEAITELDPSEFVEGHISTIIPTLVSTIIQIDSKVKDRFEQYVVPLDPTNYSLVFAYLDEDLLRVAFQREYPQSGKSPIPTEAMLGYAVTVDEFKDEIITIGEDLLQFAKKSNDIDLFQHLRDDIIDMR